VIVATRALPVINGENLRQLACLLSDSVIISGVVNGRHLESPSAINCGIGRAKGRGNVTERFLIVSRCQNKMGDAKPIMHIEMKTLEMSSLGVAMLWNRVDRKVKEVEARLSKGTVSSPMARMHTSDTSWGAFKSKFGSGEGTSYLSRQEIRIRVEEDILRYPFASAYC
jgi:hypothetical protein